MSLTSDSGLKWYPLYWRFDDQWQWYEPSQTGFPIVHNHFGHVHFWMMGFPFSGTSGDAFSGSQKYTFSLQDIWGPRSLDPNQSTAYRVVGTPRWYFHVQELWRRVYIQQWDQNIKIDPLYITGRKGIKWDAVDPAKRMGPFREGRDWASQTDYFPVFIKGARGLPIDYFTSEAKVQNHRTNVLADKAKSLLGSRYVDDTFNLQHGNFLACGHPAAKPGFSDILYLSPTLEYQKVVQLNWQRMPGWEAAHDLDNEHFGDGWSVDVDVPFVSPITRKYNSPFSPTPGNVKPPGQYFGSDASGNQLVSDNNKLRYRTTRAENPQGGDQYDPTLLLEIPPEKLGQLVQWNDPYGAGDGRWVQQCLGGLVQARAQVTLEHKLGGRQDVWVDTTQYLPSMSFAGTDQNEPAS